MPYATWSERLRYRFDNFMARGTPALVGALATATVVTALGAAAIVTAFGIRPGDGSDAPSFGEAVWQGLMHAFDPSALGGDSGRAYRLVMLLVGIVGLFIFSTLIGVLTTAVSERIDELRKGRSRVLESGHTVVLGWSPKVLAVLAELVTANESLRDAVVVVLAPEDKVTMEDTIRERLDAKSTRFICRSGSSLEAADLAIANVVAARAVIVLPSDGVDADMMTMKSLLSLRHALGAAARGPIVVFAVRDPDNAHAARLAAPANARLVLSNDLIARITAQACRQSGLSIVIQELLDFDGDEIYFAMPGQCRSLTFGEQALELRAGVAIGVRTAAGVLRLNPPSSFTMAADDRLVVIANDEDAIRAGGLPSDIAPHAIVEHPHAHVAAERTLILGWNARAPRILHELDAYVAPGSTAVIVARSADAADAERRAGGLSVLKVEHRTADITRREVLESLDAPQCSHIIVLASDAIEDPELADARTLITLLHLRDIVDRSGTDVPIVSEMLDVRNRDLAKITRADDFIVSDRLIGLLLVQLAENPELDAVFSDLFDPEGSEIYLKPVSDYILLGEPVTFNTLVSSALQHGETAIGFRIGAVAHDAGQRHGVVLNPNRAQPVVFAAEDRVIVLAES